MNTPFPAVDPTHPQGQGPGDQSKVTQEVGDWELWSSCLCHLHTKLYFLCPL